MKKIIVSLLAFFTINMSGVAFAKDYAQEQQLKALKNAKNAKVKVINAKISVVSDNIDKTIANSKMSDKERNRRLSKYQKELETLNNQKTQINIQYKKDKKRLKSGK